MKPSFSFDDFVKQINTPEAKQSLKKALKDNEPSDNYENEVNTLLNLDSIMKHSNYEYDFNNYTNVYNISENKALFKEM